MNTTRRSFIAGAATVGAVAAVTPAVSLAEEPAEAQKTYSFEIPPEPITDFSEEFEADVVVVGAGFSGLVTALSSIQNGLSVIVVTASKAPVSRGGSINASYSKCMEQAGIEKCPPSQYHKEAALNMTGVDQRKWFAHYNNSEEAMNWLVDTMAEAGYAVGIENTSGIPLDSVYSQYPGSHGFYDPAVGSLGSIGMNMPLVVNALAAQIEGAGGTIHYNSIGKQLVREDGGAGRVDALVALREDGTYAKYTGTKAVVLATGDFSKNKEMMEKYCGWYVNRIPAETYESEVNYDAGFDINGLYRGEGQQMGLWVGAAWQKVQPNAVMDGTLVPGPHQITYQSCWSVLLNNEGKRYMDEYVSCVPCVAAGNVQKNGEFYALWTPQYLDYAGDVLLPSYGAVGETDPLSAEELIARWDALVNGTTCFKADTLEELFEAAGLPVEDAVATVNHYNEMCAAGEDTEFYKDPSMLIPVSEPPFYLQKNLGPVVLTVLGGLRTDANMRVCDEADEPIPGLYNVGTMVGDFYAGMYTFQLCGINYGALGLTAGYLTGKFIAENE